MRPSTKVIAAKASQPNARRRPLIPRRLAQVLLLCAVAAAASLAQAPQAFAADCHGAKFIGVRGSGEAAPLGKLLPPLYEALLKRKPTLIDLPDPYAIDYPAISVAWGTVGFNFLYQRSEGNGAKALKDFLKTEIAACPSEQIVLAGWSQGSHVIGDVLSDGAKGTDRITDDELTHIAAVTLFADPRFNGEESFDRGSYEFDRNGILGARTSFDLSRLGDKIQSWCQIEDTVCQGGVRVSVHDSGKYAELYKGEASAFIARKLGWPTPTGGVFAGKVDVAFSIDTTGSMGSSINAVKTFANTFADQLAATGANFQLGLVDFKDAEADPYGARVDLAFTADKTAFQNAVNALSPGGGGDTPEYALTGIQTAISGLTWRSGAKKTIIVITDAAYKDPEAVGGLTTAQVLQAVKDLDPAQIYPVLIGGGKEAQYQPLADGSGGTLYVANDPAAVATAITDALKNTIAAPVAALTTRSPARPGDTVNFTAGGSYDPTGDDLTSYEWDFNGDGVIDETTTTERTAHVYAAPFTGTATVTVHSTGGGKATASAPIDIRADAPHAPGAISGLTGDPAPSATLAFHWQPPADDGGAPITGYQVAVYPAAGGDVVALGLTDATSTSVVLTGADPGEYTVSLRALNDAGIGPETTATVTVAAQPTQPPCTEPRPPHEHKHHGHAHKKDHRYANRHKQRDDEKRWSWEHPADAASIEANDL